MPRSLQTMPQQPIAVSNNAKPESSSWRIVMAQYRAARHPAADPIYWRRASRSAFMAMRSGFGIGRARPPLMKATRTLALDQKLLAAHDALAHRDRGALDLLAAR